MSPSGNASILTNLASVEQKLGNLDAADESLRPFAPLSEIEGVTLISLQKGDGVEQRADCGFPVGMLPGLDDGEGAFQDTAAVMTHLDLVVTSDTAIAHLAGGLGVPTIVALSKTADWRWFEEREDSPWYESVTLMRQSERTNWDELFERMADRVRRDFENLRKQEPSHD